MLNKIKLLLLALGLVMFVGCGDTKDSTKSSAKVESNSNQTTTLKVGATPNPHAIILENLKDDLKNEGIDLQIVEFSDYILPNMALNDGSIDANFYQHQPYLDKMVEDKKLKIKSIAKAHIEPLGFYSKKIKDIKDLEDGSTIALPNDPSNGGRALILLHNNGLIKLKDSNNLYATEIDIIENKKNLKLKSLDAAMLPKIIDDVDAAVINGNFALQAGFSAKEAIFLEDERSPYANVLVVRENEVDNANLLKLKEALNSQKTKQFLEDKFKGEIIPAF